MAKTAKKKIKISLKPKFRKRVCLFCQEKTQPSWMEYTELEEYLTNRGGIMPRKLTSVCAKHQRALATSIKNARHLGLLPFTRN